MSCIEFEKYELGEIDSREFRQHLKVCAHCREQKRLDDRLMSLARSLKEPIPAPGLWDRIENTLKKEGLPAKPQKSPAFPFSVWLAAAAIILAVAVGTYFWLTRDQHGTGLLHQAALKKVEQKENEYMKAIAELEKQTLPNLENMNVELMLLYKDRLETINNQIRSCREALAENPANTHIRRYMLAALQDKKETLHEILISQKKEK
ncbi:MAG: hypothetical protein GTO45_17005 [Candidatus Aminicenantes bacterium]|nr:hypothetical protein [Candidatus Aminicenantes bacterium]NIM80437.1 hypothetical protein [Candidatus Aminicenantes bacterium]NIN19830.1 hypothetical protein [Candidatus Aminicenantes bacterium]NIN43706.1 hypothetical protein [Candidatus Aminicenantes bacterium]NIN86456.1 hypothetical protein [Candidatus Aminicenantes bacterium]